MEYQDTPNAWYRLDGGFDAQLGVQIIKDDESGTEFRFKTKEKNTAGEVKDKKLPIHGRWQKHEATFTTNNETTTMALDFRIVGANVGEMWIDKLSLENLSVEKESSQRLYPSASFYHPEPASQKATSAK